MEKEITIAAPITVKELAEALDMKVTDVMSELMKNGVMATVNDSVDFETAAIVSEDLGVKVIKKDPAAHANTSPDTEQATVLEAGEGSTRPPVVAVMGHVDHGKTTLLDALKDTDVAGGEAGGITQHISSYQVQHNGRTITFLDTPGHEAFSLIREHGARLTDVAIVVVAADDGIKPQTEETLRYVQEAGVRMVVAVNKVDKPGADPVRVRQQLADKNLIPEDWGGDVVTVDISAKEKTNLDQLLDMVLLVADIEDLRALDEGPAQGTVIESQMITGKGAVATVLIQHGILKVGDFVVAGSVYGKVRSLEDFSGKRIKQATPSMPVAISGWKDTPRLGAFMKVVSDEKSARQLSSEAGNGMSGTSDITQADAMTAAMAAGKSARVPLIVKADVDGSLMSLVQGVEMLGNEDVRAEIVGRGVGPISESDVALAESTGAIIIGFNVSVPGRIKQLSMRSGVEIKIYRVIYELLDDLRERLSGLLAPEIVEEVKGKLRVKGVFKTAQKEVICGGEVLSGMIAAGHLVRLVEGEEIGSVKAVQKEQQVVKNVAQGETCGVSITTKSKAKLSVDDELEFFTRQELERTL